MISLFGMLGFCFILAIALFSVEYIIYLGYDKETNSKTVNRNAQIHMERFKRKNDEIWKSNIGPLEVSRRLRLLSNDLAMANLKSEVP